jgi:pimeloyl-ACP methyl ester carboxylesterase
VFLIALGGCGGGADNNDPTPPTPTPTPSPQLTVTEKQFNAEANIFLADPSRDPAIAFKRLSINEEIEIIVAYGPGSSKKPLIFDIHGGGGRKEHELWTLDRCAREGFFAIAPDVAAHGDSNKGPLLNMDAWLETVGYIDTLIEYCTTRDDVDVSNFAVSGSSMGGSITLLYGAYGKNRPKVLLPELGAPDFTQILNGRANEIMNKGNAVGAELPEKVMEKATELSPTNHLEKFLGMPMYARFGELDYENGIEGVKEFKRKLEDAGETAQQLIIIEGGGHGGFPDDSEEKMNYLKAHMGNGGGGGDPAWDGKTSDISWYDENKEEFSIATPEQFAGLMELVNNGDDDFFGKTIVLTSDIDLASNAWTPIGKDNEDSASFEGALAIVSEAKPRIFRGKFDGKGHTISNAKLTASISGGERIFGVFGSLHPGEIIENVKLKDVTVDVKNENVAYLGILSGRTTSGGEDRNAPEYIPPLITNCEVSGTITLNNTSVSTSTSVGGLVGRLSGGAIVENCKADVTINISGQAKYVGGLIGASVSGPTITNSEASGRIIIDEDAVVESVGGFAGSVGSDSTLNGNTADPAKTGQTWKIGEDIRQESGGPSNNI